MNASNLCNENKNSRTEPDIIICTSEELVFIETKVDSSNPIIQDSQKYKLDKYRNSEYYKDLNKACSLYELVRNWTLGNIMAKLSCKSFKLINLLPQKYIKKESESQAQKDLFITYLFLNRFTCSATSGDSKQSRPFSLNSVATSFPVLARRAKS